jgi:carboxymethylenebutenolidase
VVGFCFGGYISNYLAAAIPDVMDAAVPFYGTPAGNDIVGNVKGPVMVQLAQLDDRVNATWEPYEEVLKSNDAPYKMHIYEGTRHGFHNDSTGRFDEKMANLAWDRTLEFFGENLRG